MEFGIFKEGLPIHRPGGSGFTDDWSEPSTIRLLSTLCKQSGFKDGAWRDMPLFDLARFCRFAQENHKSGRVRLYDEHGTTDDGRFRRMDSTLFGRKLYAQGELEMGRLFLMDYLCKEFFRLRVKETGQGGYQKDVSQVVTVRYETLMETGRRNLMVAAMMSAK